MGILERVRTFFSSVFGSSNNDVPRSSVHYRQRQRDYLNASWARSGDRTPSTNATGRTTSASSAQYRWQTSGSSSYSSATARGDSVRNARTGVASPTSSNSETYQRTTNATGRTATSASSAQYQWQTSGSSSYSSATARGDSVRNARTGVASPPSSNSETYQRTTNTAPSFYTATTPPAKHLVNDYTSPSNATKKPTAGTPSSLSSRNYHNCGYCQSVNNATPSRHITESSPIPSRSSMNSQHRTRASQYSLKGLTFNVESSPKDRSFVCENNVVYCNQWTTCTATVVDVVNGANCPSGSVEITSNSSVEFRNATLKDDRLKFSLRVSDAGNVTLTITIRRYSEVIVIPAIVKAVYTPCSSLLSEVTIRDIKEQAGDDTCVLRVHVIDVFGNPAVRNLQNNCNIEVKVSDGYDDDVTFSKTLNFGYELCYDLSVEANRPWANYIEVLLNGKKLKPAERFELPNDEQQELLQWRTDALDDDDEESIPSSVVYNILPHGISTVYMPLTKHCDDGTVLSYQDKNCEITRLPGAGNYGVICRQTTKYDVMGPDFAHINNIKRVLDLKDRLQVEETANYTSITFCSLSLQEIKNCKEVVLHLLRGLYYRKKASQCARVRMEWKDKFNSLDEILHSRTNDSSTLTFCKYFKDYYGKMMNEYNRNACEDLYSFFNYSRHESEVDLHGLLVADEKRLTALKLDLLQGDLSDEEIDYTIKRYCRVQHHKRRPLKAVIKDLKEGCLTVDEIHEFMDSCNMGNKVEDVRRDFVRRSERSKAVNNIIDQWRKESDEAIRMLERKLQQFDVNRAVVENSSPWLEIIVGAGHHSREKDKQNIRPKVEMFLKKKGHTFRPVNKGSLVVTFVEYSGPEPCFGEYYCSKCDRCWKSSKSYKGKYQKCSRCHQECWPVKQRQKERVCNYRRDGMEENRKPKPHQSHLCQKCQELGYPCNEDDYYSD